MGSANTISLRVGALSSLISLLETEVPELFGKIEIERDDASQSMPWPDGLPSPSMLVKPHRFNYLPNQASEHHIPSPDQLVVEVGSNVGMLMLKISSDDRVQRDDLEQRVLDLFYSTPLSPGLLLTDVTELAHLGAVRCSWELEADVWHDEFVFDRVRQSHLEVTGIIPVLGLRKQTYELTALKLGLTEDFVEVFDSSMTSGPNVEVRLIEEDGSITTA